MAQAPLLNTFSGSMNRDVNPSMLKEGDYVLAENCRIGFSEEDNMGCVENVKSTLKVANLDLIDETGRFLVIGSCSYEAKSLVYYFVKDTQGTEHGIYEFDLLTRTISKVLKNPLLNFTTKIRSAVYQNDMLTWTDGNEDTRQIFVTLAKQGWYTDNKYDYTTLIKVQPNRPITTTLIDGLSTAKNTLGSATYQFIYRYVFFGFQKSAWSMPSRMIATGYDKTKKAIQLTLSSTEILDTNNFRDFVKYIEVGVRTNDTQPFMFINRYKLPSTNGFPLVIDFYNESQYPAIATTETARYYDDVPRTSQSVELAANRLLLANNKRGFNNIPSIQALNLTTSNIDTLETNGTYFKSGGSYGFGVTLYDRYQRRSYTYPLGGFTTTQRNGELKATKASFGLIESSINGFPDWVDYWAICLTKVTNVSKFVQVHVKDVVVVGGSSATKITFSPTFKAPTSPNTAWVFTTGDLCSLRSQSDGVTPLNPSKLLFDIPLQLDSTTGNLFIEWDGTTYLPNVGVADDMVVEFYTPKKSAIAEFYYEIGELNPVALVSGKKRFGTTFSANGALVELTGGDTQYRNGTIPLPTPQENCEAMSPSTGIDYETWNHNIGRPNVVAQQPEVEINSISDISFSNPYIQGTNLNGFNTVEFDSNKIYPIELGAITKIIVARDWSITGSVLLVVTEYNCYSIYIGKIQVTNTDGSSQLTLINTLLGSYNLLAGGYGSIHPESVNAYGTTVRGFDALKGIIWRYSQDGLTPLSQEYGLNAYTSNLAVEILPQKANPLQTAVGTHDPYFDEYLINVKNPQTESSNIVAFNETKNGFSTYYKMNPDWMQTINRQVVFWKNGVLYLGRAGSDFNTLLGERVTSKLSFVSKFNPFVNMNGVSVRVYAQDNWQLGVKGIKRTKSKTQETSMKYGVSTPAEDTFMYPIAYDTNNTVQTPMKSRYFVVEMELEPSVDYLSVLYGTETIVASSDPNPKR